MAFTSGSPNAGQLQIGIALVLEDRFSNQAREASSQIRQLHQDAKNLTNANLSAVRGMAGMAAAAGGAAVMGIGSAVSEGAEFIDIMTFVGAIARDTGVSFDQLNSKAKTLGRDTMFTSKEIASAMQYMAMAGQTTTEIFNNITGAADLANATMSRLGDKGGAADIMTNIMRMFRIDSTEASSTRVADVLSRTVTRSNTNLYDLGEAIKYAGTTTTNLGATLEQVAASIGVLGDAGIQGSMAGTALANAYRYLSRSVGNPNYKGNKALKSLGLGREDFLDAQGNLIDLGLALQKISAAVGDAGNVDAFNTLIDILGVRGERAGSTMIRAFQNYSSLLNEINTQSAGTAADVRTRRMESLAGAIEIVDSTWENLRTSFAEALGPTLQPFLRTIGRVLEGLQAIFETPVGPWVAALITGATVTTTIAAAVIALKASFRLLFNDSTVSLRNMFLVMDQGWNSAKINATQYAAIEASIIAQRKAGAGNAALFAATAATNRGKYIGRVMMAKGSGNRFYARDNSGGVRRISPELAQRYGQRFPTQNLLKVGSAAGTGAAAGGLIARFGMGNIGKGLLSFLGGPWGLLASVVITFLPLLVDLFRGNKKSNDEAVVELQKLTAAEERKRNVEAANITPEERNILLADALNKLSERLAMLQTTTPTVNPDGTTNAGNLTIVIDGQTVMRDTIKRNQLDQIINVGAK